MTENAVPSRPLLRLLLAPFAFVVVTSVILIGGMAATVVRSQNETAIRDSVHMVRSVVADRERRLSDQLLDYSYWDDAVLNLVSRFDPIWADKNVGLYMHDKFGISTSFVLDDNNRTVYAMVEGKRTQDDLRVLFSTRLDTIIGKARSRPKTEPPVTATGLLEIGDTVHIVAASVLTRFKKEGANRERDVIATGSILIFTRAFDAKMLDEFSKRYLLDDLRLVAGESALLSAALPLTAPDGKPLGYLTWQAKLPSKGMVPGLSLLFGGVLLVFAGAFYIFLKEVRSLIETMERSYAERRGLEEQIQHDQKMKDLGLMAGGVAHEFNNLFQGITANLELLQHKRLAPAGQGKIIDMVLEAAFKGGELTDHLLSYAGRKATNPEVVCLGSYLKDVVEFMRPILPETIEIQEPAETNPRLVRVDVSQLRASVINLLLNARDAMPRGGRIRIDVANTPLDEATTKGWPFPVVPGGYICLTVADNGEGMPPSVLERVLQPFYTTKDVGKGTGLGLSMVYGFVRQSDGYLKIDSEVGRGTEIKLFFPQVGEPAGAAASAAVKEEPPAAQSKTILYVEDDDHVRNALLKVLDVFGYRILSAENAIEALKVLDVAEKVDLLLTDIVMPGGMSGVDLADKVRASWPGVRIILITAYSDEELQRHAITGMGYTVLHKPLRVRALAEALSAALSNAA